MVKEKLYNNVTQRFSFYWNRSVTVAVVAILDWISKSKSKSKRT